MVRWREGARYAGWGSCSCYSHTEEKNALQNQYDNGNNNNNNDSNNNNRNKSNSNSNNNIVVIVEIRIEILQGTSLRMSSLRHIKVTGSDIEGRDYNNYTEIQLWLYSYTGDTGLTLRLRHGESIASPTCQMPIKPLHTIPAVAQKAVDGADEGH